MKKSVTHVTKPTMSKSSNPHPQGIALKFSYPCGAFWGLNHVIALQNDFLQLDSKLINYYLSIKWVNSILLIYIKGKFIYKLFYNIFSSFVKRIIKISLSIK